MEYIVALFALMAGAIGVLFVKKRSAEALLENTEVKEKSLELDKKIAENKSQEELEALKRDLFKKNAENKKNEPIDPKDFQ